MARIFCGFCSSNGDFGLMIGRSSRSSLLPISASTLIKQQKLYGSEKNTFTCKAIYLPQSSESGFKPHSIRFSEPVYTDLGIDAAWNARQLLLSIMPHSNPQMKGTEED